MSTRHSAPVADIDTPECLRAASAGFTVLLIGGLLHGIVGTLVPFVAAAWLPLVSAVGYSMAGDASGRPRVRESTGCRRRSAHGH